jgi:hypothetical protein
MSQTLAFRVSLGGALVIVALTLYSLFAPGAAACGSLAHGYAPVIAEELARSAADLAAIFGTGPSACRSAIAAQLNLVTWIDCLVFVPAYGAFLLFFFLAMVPRDDRAAFIGFVASAAAVVGDYIENICLFQVTASPDAAGFAFALLPWATGLKWLALGFAAAVGGMILLEKGRENYPAVLACAAGLLGTVLATINPHLFGAYVSNAVALSWLVFLVVDIRGVLAGGSAVMQLEPENGA